MMTVDGKVKGAGGGSDISYTWASNGPLQVWNIPNPLGRPVNVQTTDMAGNVIEGDIMKNPIAPFGVVVTWPAGPVDGFATLTG
jgi:hypothetical protein